ncbi:ABC transporter ATP-binding protein [Pseudonocardia sp. H11422]|uniref:ABC transporter ATP-binding protein n=1 Tax=Pseudonocardia sp. H11422 TaxID=2835866 RepID=UPI001BDD9E50|nr:ABC transporter ATP-binding protein [Pseudonocardia sp. H11422]
MSEHGRGTDAQALLEVDGLSAAYDDTRVLEGISFSLYENETVAMLGPNGHGKTTALRAISGLHSSKSGRIAFDGVDISDAAPHEGAARGLVHVPQGDLLFGEMTVMENLLAGAYLRTAWRERKERLERVFTIFPRIHERRGQLASNLSGGERRMVAIGRGLMADGKLIMIDEPSLGLAPVMIDALYAALAELKAAGLTCLIVEESPDRVAKIADFVYLVDSGSIAFGGKPEVLMQDRAMLNTYLG